MRIEKIAIHAFRNLTEVRLDCAGRWNILVGANAQGKTNILEAIFLLGTLKSFRMAKNSELIAWNRPHALLKGMVESRQVKRELALVIEPHGKRVQVDRKGSTTLGDFLGALNVIAFSPEELFMVRGNPEVRRRYLDRAVFSVDPAYLACHREYFRILKNRNTLLRQRSFATLDAWSEQLISAGAQLIRRRAAFVQELGAFFTRLYRQITGSDEEAYLCYYADSCQNPDTLEGCVTALRAALTARSDEERQRGTTLAGPHRDDLRFFLNGTLLKQHGSQGQQRSFILAMKMAEIENACRHTGFPPVLLLDDLTSELDKNRLGHLLEFLAQRQIQVFMTTTDLATLPAIAGDSAVYRVNGGEVSQRGMND